MSRSPTNTHGRVSHNVCLFQENSGYRKRLRKAGQKEAILWPNLWPLRSACTDFVEATSIHHILAKILEQLWPEIGRLLLRPRVPGHVGSTTEAEIRMHWLRLRLTRHSDMRLLNADTIVGAGASALDGDIWLKCCCFTSTETVGLSGTGAQDVHIDFHTVPEI